MDKDSKGRTDINTIMKELTRLIIIADIISDRTSIIGKIADYMFYIIVMPYLLFKFARWLKSNDNDSKEAEGEL